MAENSVESSLEQKRTRREEIKIQIETASSSESASIVLVNSDELNVSERTSDLNLSLLSIATSMTTTTENQWDTEDYVSEPQEDKSGNNNQVLQRKMSGRKLAGKHAQPFGKLNDKKYPKLLFGTTVDEDHANYVLMYDMLTGIRVAVSRCEAKAIREPKIADFKSSNKLAFDITGNEMTPSSKYDFKFKDYAPWVFRNIRARFKIDAADYLISLTGKYVLSELGSPGKSGSFFYYSQDFRFIIKTVHQSEHLYLRKILKHYYEHLITNPDTLLCRFYGLHRVKLPRGKKIHFVVMGNILPPHKDVHEIFDLKGSTAGRLTKIDEDNPLIVKKDLNWLSSNHVLKLGPTKRDIFLNQLSIDSKFLRKLKIMDYSMLLAIHYISRVFEPKTDSLQESNEQRRTLRVTAMRKAIAESDPVSFSQNASTVYSNFPERDDFYFYCDEGGFRGTDSENHDLDELYFLGVIDILTPYNFVKKIEHTFKSIGSDEKKISAVPPKFYAQRFMDFMSEKVAKL